MWLRVTPDDGGSPVLDAPVPTAYPPLPADATFPIDAACEVRCERGYWIQAAVYDPAGRSSVDIANAIFGWAFDASVSSAVETGASVQVTLDAEDGREPPPSLILRGTGDPFRIDADQRAVTLVIDAKVPERDGTPLGDRIADVPIVFRLTTFNVGGPGQPWLSNGHYLGDGSTGDDVADTGATGGPVTVSSPAGRPFAACAGVAQACAARTGLVQRYYHTSFDNTDTTPPYDVRWEWSVVGAPPGATVAVRPIAGETLEETASDRCPGLSWWRRCWPAACCSRWWRSVRSDVVAPRLARRLGAAAAADGKETSHSLLERLLARFDKQGQKTLTGGRRVKARRRGATRMQLADFEKPAAVRPRGS